VRSEIASRLRPESNREVNMGLKSCAAGLCAVVIAMMAFAAPPADAATKKKSTVSNQSRVVTASRARTRIRVAPRSFLDGGTEVLPGDRKFTDYALPPGYSPTSAIDNTAFSRRSPLPGPFDLPSPRNPWPWNY
jgi:hypothetical protein